MKVILLLVVCSGAVLSAGETVDESIVLVRNKCNAFSAEIKDALSAAKTTTFFRQNAELQECAAELEEMLRADDGCVSAVTNGLEISMGTQSTGTSIDNNYSDIRSKCDSISNVRCELFAELTAYISAEKQEGGSDGIKGLFEKGSKVHTDIRSTLFKMVENTQVTDIGAKLNKLLEQQVSPVEGKSVNVTEVTSLPQDFRIEILGFIKQREISRNF